MNFYKILKIKKLGRGSPDFWTRLFAKHTGGGSIKPVIVELTGKLPLMFITSDTKLHDWTIYGNNDVGKNLLEIEATSQTIDGVSFIVDKHAGTISIDGTVPSSGNVDLQLLEAGEILSEPQTFVASIDSIAPDSKVYLGFRKRKRGGGVSYIIVYPSSSVTITLGEGEYFDLVYIAARKGQTLDNVSVKPMIRLPDTSSDFEPYQIGVGEKTKNLLEITAESQTINGVTFTVDKQAGTVTATRESASSSDAILAIEIPDEVKGQNLYFSGCPSEGSANTYNVYTVDYVTTVRALQWDGTTPTVTDYGTSNNEVKYVEGHRSQIRLRIKAGYDAQNVVFKPMLRRADTTSDFIPYGYQIPLITMDAKTAEYVYKTDVFIGDSPLTEGESVSKSSTGLDVKTITIGADDYPNKLITSLSNKPEMTIKYKSKGGS